MKNEVKCAIIKPLIVTILYNIPICLNFKMDKRYLIVVVTHLKAGKEIFNKFTVKLCQCV